MNNYQLYEQLIKAIDEADEIVPCRDTDPDLWFIEHAEPGYTYKIAAQLCATCPVQNMCATYAIKAGEEYGIWGGLTPRQRQKMRSANQKLRGRPTTEQTEKNLSYLSLGI